LEGLKALEHFQKKSFKGILDREEAEKGSLPCKKSQKMARRGAEGGYFKEKVCGGEGNPKQLPFGTQECPSWGKESILKGSEKEGSLEETTSSKGRRDFIPKERD